MITLIIAYLEDPLISMDDVSFNTFIMYSENGSPDYFGASQYGGANVWIRNKTDEETRQCSVATAFIGINKKVNYTIASSYCNDNFGSELATIVNVQENSFVRDSAALVGIAIYESLYIGLNDMDYLNHSREGHWDAKKWNDGTSAIYTRWAVDEPNNYDEQDCVCMEIENFWDDIDCRIEHCFVCNSPSG